MLQFKRKATDEEVILKCERVITSCKNQKQLLIARDYIELACKAKRGNTIRSLNRYFQLSLRNKGIKLQSAR